MKNITKDKVEVADFHNSVYSFVSLHVGILELCSVFSTASDNQADCHKDIVIIAELVQTSFEHIKENIYFVII